MIWNLTYSAYQTHADILKCSYLNLWRAPHKCVAPRGGGGERVGVRPHSSPLPHSSSVHYVNWVEKEKNTIKQMAGEFFCPDITAVITNFHFAPLSKEIT
uniref:Uncharacterized protein n=1 Tax=Micrurus spixii TaxID=129469 RepID=A0A2D4N1Z3_9SAUR